MLTRSCFPLNTRSKGRIKMKMKPTIYVFHVDEHHRIHPQFIQAIVVKERDFSSRHRLTIKGNATASLIAIGACGDYFEPKEEIEYEWEFIVDPSVQSNQLWAILE